MPIRKIMTTEAQILDNEICTCGHSRLAHTDTLAKGHGACVNSKCRCIKFTWAKHKKNPKPLWKKLEDEKNIITGLSKGI